MSKMKHLLRKLHIVDHHHPTIPLPSPPQPPPPQTTPSLSFSNNMNNSASDEESTNFGFFEEEFQVQLALAISVSNPDPDPGLDSESTQIQKAKQISLGLSLPSSEAFVDSLSLRYWSYNVVNYDEKVMEGFYDVHRINSNTVGQDKMPLLVDLEAIPVSDNVDYEVILVNRATDSELRKLEEMVYIMSMECQGFHKGSIMSVLIQKIADLVVHRMGGPVSDAEEMLTRWTARAYELRNSLNTILLPLGCLDVGLSRHRALLFKVLADRINLPCMLVKGSYYTGTDEGAVNFIKVDDGSEYIIDLMGAPGTLIPAEIPNSHLQNSGLDMRSFASISDTVKNSVSVIDEGYGTVAVSPNRDRLAKVGNLNSEEASFHTIQSKGHDRNTVQKNQIERFEQDFGKLRPPLGKTNEGSSDAHEKASAAQKMQVKDVSKYVISAAKNPEFAQKLHAILLDGGSSLPADLISYINAHNPGEQEVLAKLSNLRMVADEVQCYPDTLLPNNEQYLIPSSGGHVFSNTHYYASKQKHSAEVLAAQQQELQSPIMNPGHTLPPDATSKGFVLVSNGHEEMSQADDAAVHNVFVNQSGLLSRASEGEQICESSILPVAYPFKGQPEIVLDCDDNKDKIIKVFNNIEEDKSSVAKVDVCRAQNGRINPELGEVAKWEIRWEDIQIGERIGIGSYGEVYHGEWNSNEVAVKKFMNQDISGDALAQFKCEVEIMLRLRHPNVVLFMGAVTHPPNLSILTEYLPRGSLFKLLRRPNIQIDERRRMRMALDVAKGMNYLHTSNPIIVHRDLKTPNLLVDKNWVVKVCDFGMSRMKHHTFLSSKSTAGTPEWMAPEVLRNEPSNEKSDVYSFGVILWELATLQVPWTEMNSMQVVGAVGFQDRHLDIPAKVDPMVAELITDCWNPDQNARPSFAQIITRLRCLQHVVVEKTDTHINQQ